MSIFSRTGKVCGMRRRLVRGRWIAILALPLAAGCGHDMALHSGAAAVDTHTKSIVIFTLVVRNDMEPAFGVAPTYVRVKSIRSGTTSFQLAGDWAGHGTDRWAKWTGTSEFPISLGLEPGQYKIDRVKGFGANEVLRWYVDFPCNFPLDLTFDVPAGSVVYLGHVVMINRERIVNEDRAGPIIPFIGQSVSGYSRGSMDVSVTDQSADDIPRFLEKYPSLKGLTIKKAIITGGQVRPYAAD
jgi:hypothetical protein